jgi:hypothetical protein
VVQRALVPREAFSQPGQNTSSQGVPAISAARIEIRDWILQSRVAAQTA